MMQMFAVLAVTVVCSAPQGPTVVVGDSGRPALTGEQIARDYMFVTRTQAYVEQDRICTARGLDELFYPVMVCQ